MYYADAKPFKCVFILLAHNIWPRRVIKSFSRSHRMRFYGKKLCWFSFVLYITRQVFRWYLRCSFILIRESQSFLSVVHLIFCKALSYFFQIRNHCLIIRRTFTFCSRGLFILVWTILLRMPWAICLKITWKLVDISRKMPFTMISCWNVSQSLFIILNILFIVCLNLI
jgi:hypothetical protein